MMTSLLAVAALSEATFLRLAPMNVEPKIDNEITSVEERASSAQYGAISDETEIMTKRYAAFCLGWTEKGLYFATRTSVPPKPRALTDDDTVTLEVLPPGAKEVKRFTRRVADGRILPGVVDYGVLCAETEGIVTWAELGVAAPKDGEKWGVNMHVDFSAKKEHGRWHYAKGRPEELATVVFDSKSATPSLVDFGKLEAWRASMNYRMCFRFNNSNGERTAIKPDVTLYRGIGVAKLDSDPDTNQELTKETYNAPFVERPLEAKTCQDVVIKVWVIIPGAVAHLNADLDVGGKKTFRRTLRWDTSRGLDWDALEVPFVKAAFYPVKDNFLRVYFNPFHVTTMCRGALRVYGKASGKVFWEKELVKTNGRIYTQYVHDHLPKDLPEDDYVVRFGGQDMDGKKYSAEATFAVKKFPWQNNMLGKDRVLVPPFTAIKVEEGDRISFLQTGYQCGGILWDKVFFKDENLLAGPIELKLNDQTFTVTDVRYIEKSPDRVVREVKGELGAMKVTVTQDYDQDGFCFLTFAFDSAEEVEVKTLRLSVPLRNELAKYFNVLNRAGDRRAGPTLDFSLKDGEGEVWNSTAWTQGGRRKKFPAAIQPYIWFGGAMKGFCWTMDSVRHLSLDNDVPAERIIRKGGAATLVCDLVNVPVKWKGAKTIEMGVQPTPVKPKAPECGRFASQLYKYACPSNAVKITSCWGGFALHPMVSAMNRWPNDDLSLTKWVFAQEKVDEKAFRDAMRRYVEKNGDWFASSRTTSAGDFLKYHEHDSRYMGTKVGMCYNNPMLVTCFWPEWEMYKSEWWPDACFVPENYYNEYMGQLARSRIDFQLWHEKRQLDLGAGGIYFDCFFTRGAEGLESENVWVKENNDIQPQLTGFLRWRELLKRTAILCLKEGRTYAGRPIVENHDTSGNAVPMASWLMTGLSTERGQDGGDFQDRFPEAYTLVDIVGAQAGKGTRFLAMTDRGDQARKDRELKSLIGFMYAYGIFAVEDQGLYSNLPEFEKAWNAVFDYGWGRPEVEQICYWDDTKEKPVTHTGRDVRLTVARKSQSMLLMFGNLGEATEFSFETKGKARYDYIDGMTGRPVDPAHVAIERHGYRLIRARAPRGPAFDEPAWPDVTADYVPREPTMMALPEYSREGLIELMKDWQTPITSEVRMLNGAPELFVNGEPRFMMWGTSGTQKCFDPKDVPYSFVTVWNYSYMFNPKIGEWNYEVFDRNAYTAAKAYPGAMFIWQLQVYPSGDWAKKYPEDRVCDEKGERHIFWGEINIDYSVSSDRAREHMVNQVTNAIAYLEKSPYANRIAGYRVASEFGVEWIFPSPKSKRAYDHSKPAREKFPKWAAEHYPELKDTSIPTGEEQWARDGDSILWDRQKNLKSAAFREYNSEMNEQIMLAVGEAAKKAVGGRKVIGTYHGYTFYQNWNGYNQGASTWNFKRTLDSGVFGWVQSPQSYMQRRPGGCFADMKPFASHRFHGIISACENDLRTSYGPRILPDSERYGQMPTQYLSQQLLRRDFAVEMCRRHPIHHLNCPNSVYMPEMVKDLKELRKLGDRLVGTGVPRRKAEIALVMGEKSFASLPMLYLPVDNREYIQEYAPDGDVHVKGQEGNVFNSEVCVNQLDKWARCGAPVDYLLAEDLKDNPGDYKLYVFLCNMHYDDGFRQAIAKLRERNATLVWTWAPGWSTAHASGLACMKDLTGIEFAQLPKPADAAVIKSDGRTMGLVAFPVTPLFYPVTKPDEVLGSYASGEPGLAVFKQDKATVVYSATWQLDMDFICDLVRRAGVYTYVDSRDPTDANERLFTLHARYPGRKTVKLPKKVAKVYDVFNKRVVATDTDTFTFDSKLHETHLFEF